jgi:hypothetical protein
VFPIPHFTLVWHRAVRFHSCKPVTIFFPMAGSENVSGGFCRVHPTETVASAIAIFTTTMLSTCAEFTRLDSSHDNRQSRLPFEAPPNAPYPRCNPQKH